jgi:hypothetical protein
MPIKVFTIPVRHADWAERELNQFVQSHRVLAVFTNDHLAQMVERRVKNKADLEQIAGIGEALMENYCTFSRISEARRPQILRQRFAHRAVPAPRAPIQGRTIACVVVANPRRVPHVTGPRSADRQSDVAAFRELLPGMVRPLR